MQLDEKLNCARLLLDLVCYEVYGRRLSPEMEQLLEEHLRECLSCRREVINFNELLVKREKDSRNFG